MKNIEVGENELCSVCGGRQAREVVSSGIAPVSGGLCDECLVRGAENLGVVHFWIYTNGGPASVPVFAQRIVSFHDGSYVTWPQIAELYQENELEIRMGFEKEFSAADLEDDPLDESEGESREITDDD